MPHLPDDIDATIGERDLTAWKHEPARRVVGWVGQWSQSLGARFDVRASTMALVLVSAIGGVLAAVATVFAGIVYDAVVERNGIAGLDQPTLLEMLAWRSPTRDHLVTLFTDIGSSRVMPFIAAGAAFGLSWRRLRRTPVVLMVIATLGSLAMTVVGKWTIHRVRPDHLYAVPPFEDTPSFPSGHTLNATVIAGLIAYLVLTREAHRATRVLTVAAAVLFAGAMGLSRVYLGHHWLTDVVAAWALAAAWLAVVITAHRIHLTLRQRVSSTQDSPSRLKPKRL